MSLWYIILILVLTLALPIVEKRVKSEVQEEGEDLYLGHQEEDDALDVMEEPEMEEAEDPAPVRVEAQPAAVQSVPVHPVQCSETEEKSIGKRGNLKERLKSNPEDMILLSEILRPKYKEY